MDLSFIKKITYLINTVILFLVIGLMWFFYVCKAGFLVYFSIPTMFIYIIGYFLIYKEKLYAYLLMVYIWLTFYMCITTICLGTGYGFYLYCLSMIPVIFIADYMAYQLKGSRPNAILISVMAGLGYLLSTGYVKRVGPIYKSEALSEVFWQFNSIIVISFLIYYSFLLVHNIIKSEEELRQAAYIDRLTGLYNRHYMIDKLDETTDRIEGSYLAMLDIDKFKSINDEYGHNTGDYILKTLSEIMKDKCDGETISRWGGEEFLILGKADENTDTISFAHDKMEKLRQTVENTEFKYDEQKINVTVTIGVAEGEKGLSVDNWVQKADSNLYKGKNSGRNQVVTNL
ncbi:diguanylate cyclase (GGDEF) domain-containing protein [Lachnospiraceae bacterium]|nr:diguanylate cyclase (GGDEF) domain-containing protein [Lachnospiraceae bacterium]